MTAVLLGGGFVIVIWASRNLGRIEKELHNGMRDEIREILLTYRNTHVLFTTLQDRILYLEDLEAISKEFGRVTEQRVTEIEKAINSQETQYGNETRHTETTSCVAPRSGQIAPPDSGPPEARGGPTIPGQAHRSGQANRGKVAPEDAGRQETTYAGGCEAAYAGSS